MPWFNVDDGLTFHPKVLAVGNGPIGAWVRFGAYCAKHSTEGFVPTEIVRMVASRREITTLVDAGWLYEEPDGYRMHDYLDYNRDAATVARDREKAAERKRRQRERQRDTRDSHGVTPPVTDGVTDIRRGGEATRNRSDNGHSNARNNVRYSGATGDQPSPVENEETAGSATSKASCHAVSHGPQAKPSQAKPIELHLSPELAAATPCPPAAAAALDLYVTHRLRAEGPNVRSSSVYAQSIRQREAIDHAAELASVAPDADPIDIAVTVLGLTRDQAIAAHVHNQEHP